MKSQRLQFSLHGFKTTLHGSVAAVSLLLPLKNFLWFFQGLRTLRKFHFGLWLLIYDLLSIQIGSVCFCLALAGIFIQLRLRYMLAAFHTLAKWKVNIFQGCFFFFLHYLEAIIPRIQKWRSLSSFIYSPLLEDCRSIIYMEQKKANELHKLKKCQINKLWHVPYYYHLTYLKHWFYSSFILYICMSSSACIYILYKRQSL